MSKYVPGQAGSFRGKMGQTVISSWRGIDYGKAAPKKSNKAGSTPQVNQRTKFGIMTAFLAHMESMVSRGYRNDNPKMTAMNIAVKNNLLKAITTVGATFSINYPKVELSSGKLYSVTDPVAVAAANRIVNVSWTMDDSPNKLVSPEDPVNFSLYSPATGRSVTAIEASERQSLTRALPIPRFFIGDQLHVYMFLQSVDGKQASRTEYLGLITILA